MACKSHLVLTFAYQEFVDPCQSLPLISDTSVPAQLTGPPPVWDVCIHSVLLNTLHQSFVLSLSNLINADINNQIWLCGSVAARTVELRLAQSSPDLWQLLNRGGRVKDPWGIQGTGCFPITAYGWGESYSPPCGSVILSLLTMCYCYLFLVHSRPRSLKPRGVLTWFLAVTITTEFDRKEKVWDGDWNLKRDICVCLCSHVQLTSFSVCWGGDESVSASWTTVSQTFVCGPLAVSLNWTGSSRLAPSPLAKMDPSVRTLKIGSLLWKATALFPMQSSNFTVDKRIDNILT